MVRHTGTMSALTALTAARKLTRADYRVEAEPLQRELGHLQRLLAGQRIPVAILVEGWEAAWKGGLINRFLLALDPRGFSVRSVARATRAERMRPYFWRFWKDLPAAGRIAVFDRGWLGPAADARALRTLARTGWHERLREGQAIRGAAYRPGHRHPEVVPAHIPPPAGRTAQAAGG